MRWARRLNVVSCMAYSLARRWRDDNGLTVRRQDGCHTDRTALCGRAARWCGAGAMTRLSGGNGSRPPPDDHDAEDPRLLSLLSLGVLGVGFEVVGALYGGTGGRQVEAGGLVLTLVSAGIFVGSVAYAVGAHLWRRWRQ